MELQLQNDDLVIGTDVVRLVLNDVGNAIQKQITDEISQYQQVTEEQKKELLDTVQKKIKDIEIQENVSVTHLNNILKTSVDNFKTLVQESVQEITNRVRDGNYKRKGRNYEGKGRNYPGEGMCIKRN